MKHGMPCTDVCRCVECSNTVGPAEGENRESEPAAAGGVEEDLDNNHSNMSSPQSHQSDDTSSSEESDRHCED